MKKILLEIITPERIAFSSEVDMINAPTSTGQIGILPGHVSLFTRLTEGEVKIMDNGKEVFLAIGGGFMEVSSDKTTILVTAAYKSEEINEKEVIMAKKKAEEALAAKPSGEALLEAQSLFRRSEIALKVLRRKKPLQLNN
ncbi:ATP synthase F1 subunit epsilon [Candidatus Gottesmanbacteria bacterium CG11_big_fil_rev_8_21_14_0_20_37_11]|uniref:ATP synthase epsilon chain n=3 Tax=Candidatus Gottesmaniibacteriota TaxID=1752720 RepID=A0A2M7RSE2_9BACT|nr:MAG: ATP synthase F1 subunit epsilon [Candidatus Gottesmanbacteria bacterium CG1_02_37_22]PIP32293.1 MAG: ATP synthase F1 subunit epsilon [Candidatus Gottesmanbacteria bacterium CG23_combo_of_CG06-09_8_20_14_all_37_19]PIR07967.1 MAG: ATP synthase F1 subunit epsilon [Candidatus Gottesmanbacteria bacterium CG11_big_fil_rev_8_21_14_0_20_37_11]PIZ03241.1 MAG: ATP synthase F1 subunit epsilon [Candidatus Gottesmanbacteria bacterium CG_4_10_14_0_8_um_filter_37_24]